VNSVNINLSSLLDLSAKLNETTDPTEILNIALLSLMGKLRVLRGCAYLIDTTMDDVLLLAVQKGKIEVSYIISKDALIDNSLRDLKEPFVLQGTLAESGLVIGSAIMIQDKLRAVFCLGNNFTNQEYDSAELNYISLVSTIVSNALNTSDMFTKIKQDKLAVEQRNQLLETLFEMSTELGSVFTREQIIQTFSFRLMGQLMVSKFALALKNSQQEMELLINRFGVLFEKGKVNLLDKLTTLRLVEELNIDQENKSILVNSGIALLTPLKVKGDIRGVLAVGKKMRGEFTEFDKKFIEALGSTVVTALENARLFQQEVEKKRMEGELDVARTIQRKLLPESCPVIEGCNISAINISSKQVGGDYYDCIYDKELHRTYFAIADVSGKGMPASLLMANLQAAYRVLVPLKLPIEDLTARLNDIIYINTTPDKFVTLFCAELCHQSNTLTYTNAGHNPPILMTSEGKITELEEGGIILGAMETMIPYQRGSVTVHSGDVLLLYTDGISEAMDINNVEFGEDTLRQVLFDSRTQTSDEILNSVVTAVKNHVGSAPQSDDITAMAITIH
jgi:phosphoserine phosphatase RsbU/P